jgi:hypothetical protein
MAALGKAQREREERCGLTADDVLEYLRNVLFFNPLTYFYPSKDGKWCLTDLDALPDWVGRLIDGMEMSVKEKDGATETQFKVTLVSKATALALAMKHTTVDQHKIEVQMGPEFLNKLLDEVEGDNDQVVDANTIDGHVNGAKR